MMKFVDLLIVVPVVALVIFTVVYNLRRRKSGGCGCEGCMGCRHATHGGCKTK